MIRFASLSLKTQLFLVITTGYVLLSLASMHIAREWITRKILREQAVVIEKEAVKTRGFLGDMTRWFHDGSSPPSASGVFPAHVSWDVRVNARGEFAPLSGTAEESVHDARFREAVRRLFQESGDWMEKKEPSGLGGFWPLTPQQVMLLSIRPLPSGSGGSPVSWRVKALAVDEDILQLFYDSYGIRLMRILHKPLGLERPPDPGRPQSVPASKLSPEEDLVFLLHPRFSYPDLLGHQSLVLEFGEDAHMANATRTAQAWGEGTMVALLALGAWLLLFFVDRRVVEPLEKLERRVGGIAREADLRRRLPVDRQDEIGKLTGSINEMLARIVQAQEKLKSSEARYRAALEQSPEGLFLVDVETLEVLEANTALRRLLGYSEDDVFPGSLEKLADSTAARDMLAMAKIQLPSSRLACSFRAQDGSPVEILLSLGFLELEGRSCAFGVASDLREQRRVEEALERAERMEAVGQLAGGVAHDFNNLLTVILASSEMVRMQDGLTNESREQLEAIRGAARSASQLAQKLLLYGRKSPASPRPIRVNELLVGLKPMVRSIMGENIRLEMEAGQDIGSFTVDPHAIEQAIINLLINARDAMPQGGTVCVRTFATRLENHRLLLKPDAMAGSYYAVQVRDTGTGITDEIKRRLFEPFFTTKEPGRGTGLGLAMVYSIVKQHDGAIEVLSETGKGTCFTLLFPADEEPMKAVVHAAPVAAGVRSGRLVLVEDEPMIRRLLSRYLKNKGYHVQVFSTGDEAIKAWEAEDFACDLLITDIVMPGESSGFEVAASYLAHQGDLPVVLISGYSQELVDMRRDRGEAFKNQKVYFLPKPFEASRLAELIADVLEGKGDEARLG